MNSIRIKKIFRVSTVIVSVLALFSCKQRDDYPVFGPLEETNVDKDTIPVDKTIEAITQKIIDATDVIKTFQMDSTKVLSAGVNRTHVRFKNRLDQAMSMHILEVDLAKSNVSIQALSPFDDYLYTAQVIGDMAKYNEPRSGGRIVAAINGDLITSGAPTGSFIKSGRQLKVASTLPNADTRPFIAVKKDGAVIIGNRPKDTFPLDNYDINDFKHLVSGVSWLVYKGEPLTNTSTTLQANTAIGLTLGKKLYAVVVDGGNSAFSVGITYNDMAKVLKALGANNAFSTNVGTSAVMVQREEQLDNKLEPLVWRVVNKPSSQKGAASLNGIGIVVK